MTKILTLFLFILPFICIGQESTKSHFDRIVLQTFDCMTGCPEYLLEVSSTRNVRLYLKKLYHRTEKELFIDSTKTGYFEGKVRKKLFKKLLATLADYNCEIEQTDIHTIYFDGEPAIFKMYIENQICFYQNQTPTKKILAIYKVLITIRNQKKLRRTNDFKIQN